MNDEKLLMAVNKLKYTVKVSRVLDKLVRYVESEGYRGFDPYDVQNSPVSIEKLPHLVQFLFTQLNKNSPINFRSVIGAQPYYNTKGMALFLQGYCNLYKLTSNKKYANKMHLLFNWLKNNTSQHSKNICWGFDYPYANRHGLVERGVPTIVHHRFVVKAIDAYYQLTKSEEALAIIKNSSSFILHDLPMYENSDGIYFGYYPGNSTCVYNASLHAAETLSLINKYSKIADHFVLIEKTVKYILKHQKFTGAWYYSHAFDSQSEKKQIDFHQGFIIESLLNINVLTDNKFSKIIEPAINMGIEYYFNNQFNNNGKSLFRYPKIFPVDIHNQAQGIITFLQTSFLNNKYEKMAINVLDWTINNMYDEKGYFYYKKYKYFTNKIPYIRWGQAWMFLAMTETLLTFKTFEKY